MSISCSQPPSRSAALREAFFRCTQWYLHQADTSDPAVAAGRAYLQARGFDMANLAQVPLGFFCNLLSMKAALLRAGFSAEEIKASNLLADQRLAGRLIGPIRDAQGEILSFWAWHPGIEKSKCLYLSKDWKDRAGLFGLDRALTGGREAVGLLVVEDLLDALLFQSRGLVPAAAVGSALREITPARWQRLAESGVCAATLAWDPRPLAEQDALAAVANAARAERAPEVFVLRPDRPGAAGKLRQLFCSLPAAAIGDLLLRERIHGYRFAAARILARHMDGRPWTPAAKRAALEDAVQFYASAHPGNIPQLDRHFVPPILDELKPSLDGSPSPWAEELREQPEAETPGVPQGQGSDHVAADYCTRHNCHRMKCFCWD